MSAVISYINNQENHHQKKSFNDEVEEFIDWQLTRYLSGELTLENVVAVLDKCCNSLANATKVHV